MPERMQFKFHEGAGPDQGVLETNLLLADDPATPEHYADLQAADEGSFAAQVISGVVGVRSLAIDGGTVRFVVEAGYEAELVAEQMIRALREEFL